MLGFASYRATANSQCLFSFVQSISKPSELILSIAIAIPTRKYHSQPLAFAPFQRYGGKWGGVAYFFNVQFEDDWFCSSWWFSMSWWWRVCFIVQVDEIWNTGYFWNLVCEGEGCCRSWWFSMSWYIDDFVYCPSRWNDDNGILEH